MKIVEIKKDNAEGFIDFLGEDLVADMSRNFFRGLAAVDDGGVCHGVLVYELLGVDSDAGTNSRIRLLSCENDDINGILQDEYRKAASGEEVGKSFFETSESEIASFFEKLGFSKSSGESRELTITVSELEKLPINKKAKLPNFISNLSDVTVIQYRNFVKRVLIKGNKGSVEDLAYLPLNWFERDVSSCSISDDKIDGAMLIRKTPSGELHPMLYTAFGPDYVKNLGYMLVNTVRNVLENYPPETKVVIYRRNKEVLTLTHKLLSGYKGEEIFMGIRDE